MDKMRAVVALGIRKKSNRLMLNHAWMLAHLDDLGLRRRTLHVCTCSLRVILFSEEIYNPFAFQDRIVPLNALIATVRGLARYSFPGPERPWKFLLMAETVTWSGVIDTPGPAPMQAPQPGSMSFTPTSRNNWCQPFETATSLTIPDPY